MRYVKFNMNDIQDKTVDRKTFDKITGGFFPYVQHHGKATNRYALCPLCDNPVILLGIGYNSDGEIIDVKSGKTRQITPHGRHTKYDVERLARFDFARYECCPNHLPNCNYVRERYSDEKDEHGIRIYNTMRSYFDQVIKIIQDTIGIRITNSFARDLCRNYVEDGVDMYRGSSIDNLPWMTIFAMHTVSMFNRAIRKDSILIPFLKECDDFWLSEIDDEYYRIECVGYLNLFFNIVNFRSTSRNDIIKEYLTFTLARREADKTNFRTIFEQEVQVDSRAFKEIINADPVTLERNEVLLQIAREEMPELN